MGEWTILERLLEAAVQQHSTMIGRILLTVVVIFRILIVAIVGETVYEDGANHVHVQHAAAGLQPGVLRQSLPHLPHPLLGLPDHPGVHAQPLLHHLLGPPIGQTTRAPLLLPLPAPRTPATPKTQTAPRRRTPQPRGAAPRKNPTASRPRSSPAPRRGPLAPPKPNAKREFPVFTSSKWFSATLWKSASWPGSISSTVLTSRLFSSAIVTLASRRWSVTSRVPPKRPFFWSSCSPSAASASSSTSPSSTTWGGARSRPRSAGSERAANPWGKGGKRTFRPRPPRRARPDAIQRVRLRL
ncbi:unnamed protein product, partial [Bubo scandiacus]